MDKRRLAIIKETCMCTEFPDFVNNKQHELSCGTLVEKVTISQSKSQIRVCNFYDTNSIYSKTLYEIKNNLLLDVTSELWPYLISIKDNSSRLESTRNFKRNPKLNDEVILMGMANCAVQYKGPVPEIGRGFYFGLKVLVCI